MEVNNRLKEIFNNIELINDLPQNKIPFPQADSFAKVITVVEMIEKEVDTAISISEEFDIESRQGNYYLSAAKYLELITNAEKSGKYTVSTKGFLINNLDIKSRNEHLIKSILK